MWKDLKYEAVKHLEGKVHNSKIDVLAEIVEVAASEYYYRKNNSPKNNKVGKSPYYGYLRPSCVEQFFQRKRSLRNLRRSEIHNRNNGLMLDIASTNNGAQETLKNEEKEIDPCDDSEILENKEAQVEENPIPEYLQSEIDRLANGRSVSEYILVMEKKLYMSDVNSQQNRLLLPKTQIKEFRNENEKDSSFNVEIVEPYFNTGTTDTIILADRRDSIILRGTWGKIVKRNRLHVDSIVQIWAVRFDDGRFIFVLADLTEGFGDGGSAAGVVDLKASEEKNGEV